MAAAQPRLSRVPPGRIVLIGGAALHYGRMDLAGASFSVASVGLRLTAEGPLTRKGSAVFGRLTDRDQRRRHPSPTADKGLRFVPEVMSTNPVWTDW